MVALGILSILQLTLLPGLLVVRLARLTGAGCTLAAVFGTSLLASYLLVLILTVTGTYTRPVVVACIGVEVIALAILWRSAMWRPVAPLESARRAWGFLTALRNDARAGGRWREIAVVAAFAAGLFSVVHALWIHGRPLGEIFTTWDAVVSWDRWARDWSAGHLPRLTYHYPQLIPACWSLTYTLIGSPDVKYFARWFMGTFEFMIPFALFAAGVHRRAAGWFVGAAIAGRLMWTFGSRGVGYADSAVACLMLFAAIALLLADDVADDRGRARVLLFGGLMAAAAALTKQGGLWMAAVYPFLCAGRVRARRWWSGVPARILALYLVIVAPWYAYKAIDIRAGGDVSEFAAVTGDAHAGRAWPERLRFAAGLVNDRRVGPVGGLLVAPVLAALAIVACRDRTRRRLALWVVAPYVALWAVLWSYDARNLAHVLPILGMLAGFGAAAPLARAPSSREADAAGASPGAAKAATGGVRVLHVAIAAVVVMAALPRWFPGSELVADSLRRQRTIGDAGLNEKLYDYDRTVGFRGAILTDYQMLVGLPGLDRRFRLSYSSQPGFVEDATAPDVGYVLYCTDWCLPDVDRRFRRLEDAGAMTRVLEHGCWRLLTTCRGPCDPAEAVSDARRSASPPGHRAS